MFKSELRWNILWPLALGFLLMSCATFQNKIGEPRRLLKSGQFSEAIKQLGVLSESPSDDQLVYLLEYATALQMNGQFKESNQIFSKADKLTELNDYHSVSNVIGSALGSESMIQYKGESYEKVLINAMMAMNYLMMNQPDEALVEAKRINEKLTKMRMDGRKPYELNPFAKFLSGLIWESDKKYDDAYIAYSESQQLESGYNPFLGSSLIRSAKKAKRDESYLKWKSEYSDIKEDPVWYNRNFGELVVLFQQGWGPEKHMQAGSHRFPQLVRVYSQTQNLRVEISDSTGIVVSEVSRPIYDISQVAIKTLADDYGALVARRVGGVVAKAIASDQIRQKNELLGTLSWIAMNISDQADLRQWSTLPSSIQMAQTFLKPGVYHIKVVGLDGSGNPTADQSEADIKIEAQKKSFYSFRSVR